ncbi:hypothetical protein Rhe02_12550 [Rhizocola hellebori]|uniref:Uncharacterized protein n=2 Tax=Rhizocola hellebori TaxID=1392758 RepID=A0A8J3Q4I4_9ACTN|nr:hypothetical protein Rhe02_12550 [Rhizocola hellebori]
MLAMPLLERLARLNRTAVFVAALVVVLFGLFLPKPVGGLILLAVAGFLIAIMSTTWRVQPSSTRVLRTFVLVFLVLTGLTRTF